MTIQDLVNIYHTFCLKFKFWLSCIFQLAQSVPDEKKKRSRIAQQKCREKKQKELDKLKYVSWSTHFLATRELYEILNEDQFVTSTITAEQNSFWKNNWYEK